MKIIPEIQIAEAQWDAFVQAHPQGSPFHLSAWRRAVTQTFPHQSCGFAVCEGGEIRALLPLYQVRKLLGGKALLSIPYAVYGGPLALDAESMAVVMQHLEHLLRQSGGAYCELRNVASVPGDLALVSQYVTFIKALPETAEGCLLNLPRKARAAARKGIDRYQLQARLVGDGAELLHELFLHNKRALGSPAYPLRFFAALKAAFGEACDFLFMDYAGQSIAGVMTFYFRDLAMPYYSGALSGYADQQANNVMYVKLMESAVARGYRRFDFGRSRVGTGAHDFKVNQGFTPTPLHYQYLLGALKEIPDVSPSNPHFDLPRKIWQKLPLPVARLLGARLTAYLP